MRVVLAVFLLVACRVSDKQPGADAPAGAIDTSIIEAPVSFSNDPSATFGFTSNVASADFECRVDGAAALPCVSPFTVTLDDATHSFSVRALGGSGERDDTPAEYLWTIDTVVPSTTLFETPPAADNSTTVQFSFGSDENEVVYECSLDDGTFTSCHSGDAFGPVGDGAHAFAVRARDRAGNVDASPAIYAWTVDTSTPDTLIQSGPSGASSASTASFSFYSPDAGPGVTFECMLDAGHFQPCSSPVAYVGLDEASHTFEVRARDAVGNIDPTPASRNWRVDLTPPETTIDSGPSGVVISASAAFTFSSSEQGSTFTCSLDGAPSTSCTSPFTTTTLALGVHTFSVAAIDAAGLVDPSPASASWTVVAM